MVTSSLPLRLNRFSKFSPSNQWNFQIREAVSKHNPNQALLLFRQMKQNDIVPNNFIFIFIAKACAQLSNLKYSQMIHTHTVKSPFGSHIYVQTTMVDMYVKCDQLDYACSLFDEMTERDVASWNAMLVGFAQKGFVNEVLRIFYEMRFAGIKGDAVTAMGLTQSVLEAKNLNLLKAVHSIGIQMGMDADIEVATTWISAYAKCSDLNFAELVFYGIEQGLQTVVSWNSMIAGYANNGKVFDAVRFYKWMMLDGFRPDVSTIVSLLSACAQLEALLHGRLIHSHGIQMGFDVDIFVINTLISLYSKCGDIYSARFLFDGMLYRNCVSWTAMISGYVKKRDMDVALELFFAMEAAGEKPDLVTVLSLVSGCGQGGTLELGKWIDNYASSKGLRDNVMVCNALIDMYAKCGSIPDARELFLAMPERTVVSWTAMIAGCALNGEFSEALDLFHQMVELGLWPNHVTFLAVLRACAHAGFLEKGWECFNMMTEVYNINPGLDHYSCMADILGRRGKLKKALDFVQSMPIKPDAGIWGALLSACKIHHNIEIGEYVAHRLFELVPHVAAPYVEMANIYAFWGRWDGVAKIRSMMKCNNVNKFPGQSQVHVNGKTCTFTVEDRDHPEGIVIYALLDCLTFQLKEKAYLPQFEEISQHE
ncbi:pentatricopeptide repeat-containing protein At4g19191, mitochondrial isoform X1 [Pistacia vera]|uniref:pentatricopeptide repeat-containing protein At4g19191, mitochondrial isoform X1 n=1 Tax=Pistacia vera TaxID=55513 RepID=UPI0012632AFA|nr:pentatricopeptide repeat-containing protein At4g19191, mitochondrial isoform X1 [Pistacia vera]